ncbi:hypothetical protein FOA52_014065 [Chlamydomonas sp. UWO 241]|nr:hypothetical protein FOA52_014065 [Chlamydomonas sp. UWO 241]
MTLWSLLQAGLLMANGVAILNNERFLEKHGLSFNQMSMASPLAKSIIGGIHALQYFRSILILINILVIFVKILFG